jgi:3-hydroxybutyryl-CoA dehydrogenase
MRYSIIQSGVSGSFCEGDPFLAGAAAADAQIVVYINTPHAADPSKAAILIELDRECLGVHTGEAAGAEGSNIVGFARYRNGKDPCSDLIELVRQPATVATAIEAARDLFTTAGLTVCVCTDQPGRIVDRLVRPKYNAALRFLDEGLASREDIDRTCRLGLGYPLGPIERVIGGGLVDHYVISRALFEASGLSSYVPARRAAVAYARSKRR